MPLVCHNVVHKLIGLNPPCFTRRRSMKTITTAEQMINFFPSLTIITLPMTHPSVMKLDSQLIGMNGVSNNCFIRVSTSKCLPTYLKFLPTYLPTYLKCLPTYQLPSPNVQDSKLSLAKLKLPQNCFLWKLILPLVKGLRKQAIKWVSKTAELIELPRINEHS